MTRQAQAVLLLGILSCTQSEATSPRSDAVESLGLALTPREALAPAADLTECAEPDSTECDDVKMQLEAARRALAQQQNTRAQLPGAVELLIRFTVHGRPLELEQTYGLSVGDVRIRAVRYWLSQLSFVAKDGTVTRIPESYYLMETRGEQPLRNGSQKPVTLPAKRRERITLPKIATDAYQKIAFDIGVDALHNDDLSLAGGELSVMQNMASAQWMWFTSYIFTQLEAAVVGDLDDVQEDGGAPVDLQCFWENGANQDLRHVELTLPSLALVGGDVARTNIELELDLAVLFEGLEAELSAARSASPSAPLSSIGVPNEAQRTRLADNWSRAFRAMRVGYGTP